MFCRENRIIKDSIVEDQSLIQPMFVFPPPKDEWVVAWIRDAIGVNRILLMRTSHGYIFELDLDDTMPNPLIQKTLPLAVEIIGWDFIPELPNTYYGLCVKK